MSISRLLRWLLPLALLLILTDAAMAQECTPPQFNRSSKSANIFTPEQEMILGELTYQNAGREMRFVRDPQLLAHLNAIAEKLIKHLPPTGLHFQLFIVDIPDANAFNISGGYVFVSRKLIAMTNNEDELAGVIGHELGHAIARHGATEFSIMLKKVLNVTSVGDRKDIADKYNQLIEKWRTKSVSAGKEEDSEQQEADRIGLFAIVAAGYDPEAFINFYSRLVETKASSGNWFTDIFGKANPEEKRIREQIKITQKLPAQCRDNPKASASEDFLAWQADVVSYRYTNFKEDLPGLIRKQALSPKLRSDITHLAFSNDGKFLLAQDDFAITVIKRDPLSVAFQIPVDDADPASFTPDGEFVVFGTKNLRFEKWSLAEQKPAQIRELVLRTGCWQHEFSPDGSFMACLGEDLSLNVLDTRTGKKVWERKEFYHLTLFDLLAMALGKGLDSDRYSRLFNFQFSPDSQILVVARNNKFRVTVSIDMLRTGESDDSTIALDMKTLKPINLGGEIKTIIKRPFLLLDSGKVIGMAAKLEESGIFAFPSGKRLEKFPLAGEVIERTANPNYLLIKPLGNAKLGIFDLSRKVIVSAADKDDAALWDKFVVFESLSGEVRLSELSYDESQKRLQAQTKSTVQIPVAAISDLKVAEVSDNLQWFAASSKTRGALWNLESGERKLFVRGFRGAILANSGAGVADFPKYEGDPRNLVVLNPLANNVRPLREVPERGFEQKGRFLLERKSLTQPKKSKENDKQKPSETETEASLDKEVRFELSNILDGKIVFSRDFPKEAPEYFFDSYSGRLILYWTLGSEVGKARLKEDASLAARAKALGNKDDDYLMEIVDCFEGKTVGTLLLETGKGSFRIESGDSEGDWLILHDSENRILAYSIAEGNLRQRFFGSATAINPAKNQIVVENYPGELTFYDLTSGDNQKRLTFATGAAFLRFSLDGKKLFVLGGDQTAYVFDTDKPAQVGTSQKPDR